MPNPAENSTNHVDFVIVTALEKEAKAVVKLLDNHEVKRYEERDIRTYHVGTVPIQNTNHAYRAVVVLLPSMGELPAATAVTDAITLWNPHFVFMIGIAGGIPQDDLDLGDVVVADQVVGYDYGKVTDKTIKPRDRAYPASALLLDRIRSFWDENWAGQIQTPRPKNATRLTSKRFVGPIASGNKVIASTEFRNQLLSRWSKLIAIETESEGVYAAVFDRPQIRGTLVIRGICDMADERKGDDWQEYAADAAATYLIHFLKSRPVDPVVETPTTYPKLGPDKVSLAKLPSTSSDLFGREKELALLDAAWDGDPVIASEAKQSPSGKEIASSQKTLLAMTHKVNVLSLVAWGGVGKSALVNKWLSQLGESYRGAERVYGWSFYSQGAREGAQNSSDQFIAAALTWFGDPEMANSSASAWDKGERLAELIKAQRTLLILDGLEPLQNPPPVETGKIKDPGLTSLLRELARQNIGLVVITTRLTVDDLKDFIIRPPLQGRDGVGSVLEIDLENLSDEAGAEYLKHLGVDGTDDERKEASKDFAGHALALTLMGSYLKVVHHGDIRKRKEIPHVLDAQKQGAHARRVMKSYEVFLKGKPELDILRLMGLFDRPAEKGALDALRKEPAIGGLTDALQKMKDADWQYAINNLRELHLLAKSDSRSGGLDTSLRDYSTTEDELDCHPLLREHFGEQLKEANPAAWREGNNRLYEYYKTSAKELPDTIQEMAPLFAAVMHGCQAGRHQEAHDEIYARRIQRMNEYFDIRKIGAFGSDLATLSVFFDTPWRQPVATINGYTKGLVLNKAGSFLHAMGRLAEAAQPMQASLESVLAQKNWKQSAIAASNLSELYLTLGDVTQALAYAEQSVGLADQSGDAFMRQTNRSRNADALHQAGRLTDAKIKFDEAEDVQKKDQPDFLLLYSISGFQYCDLLLSQGDYAEIERRASQTLEWAKQYGLGLLTVALDNLSLGRAQLYASVGARHVAPLPNDAITYLNRAVDGLRQAGQQDYLPLGLLARAEFYRVTDAFDKAQKDSDEAFSVATRGGMGLFLADCHLEYARLALADRGRKTEDGRSHTREHLKIAKEMIAKMGYHRRDKEVEELEMNMSL